MSVGVRAICDVLSVNDENLSLRSLFTDRISAKFDLCAGLNSAESLAEQSLLFNQRLEGNHFKTI